MNQTGVRSARSHLHARRNLSLDATDATDGIDGILSELPERVVERPVDRRKDRLVAQRVAAPLGIPQRRHQILEHGQIIGLVGDDKLLVVQSGRVGEQLADLREVMTDADVLVHHPLAHVRAKAVPIICFGERVDDEIRGALAVQQPLLLRARPFHIPPRSQQADERVRHPHEPAHPRAIAVNTSSTVRRSSSQPCCTAALTMAYSPLTLYAASGAVTACRMRWSTSRYGSAGFTMTMSAPSDRSWATSRSASRALGGFI